VVRQIILRIQTSREKRRHVGYCTCQLWCWKNW